MKLIWAFLAVTALVFASPIVEQMLDTIVIEAAIGQTCFQRHEPLGIRAEDGI